MNTTAVPSEPCAESVVPPLRPDPSAKGESCADEKSYGQILKSSALIGGSSVINIAMGIVRTKAMAMFLGPSGFGLMGLYGSIVDLAVSIVGMGINSSGVRQIAEAAGSGETERIARTVTVLRRTSVLLGIVGVVLLVLFSNQVSTLTFGGDQHAAAVALLSLAVFFRLVSAGQGALIQGMRRITDLAKMGILGTLFGLVISISLVYFLRERGVVPALVAISAMSIVTSWWYSRKVKIHLSPMTTSQIKDEAAALLKLGFAFMASGVLMMGAAYAVRIMVVRMVGLDAAGYYQAAWTLGGLYVGFILQAMGADFYPRLTAVAKDDVTCNRLVNEQAQISMLLAGPGVLATLTFAPIAASVFYSAEFQAAADVLRWICLGATLQVITWPMGFIIVARNERHLFIWAELAWTVVNVGLSWICIKSFGLSGAGIAFWGSYVFHWVLIYSIVRRLSGFCWSAENSQTGLRLLLLVSIVFCGFYLAPFWLETTVGALVVLLSGVYSIRALVSLTTLDPIPRPLARLLVGLGLVPSVKAPS